jgi:L-fuconolactonase
MHSIYLKELNQWMESMEIAAEFPNVYAKVSGLNTAADRNHWTAKDIKPYTDFTLKKFGARRMMFGSDWPVAKGWEIPSLYSTKTQTYTKYSNHPYCLSKYTYLSLYNTT